jgi:BASS family bile acid:Na+ symporter
VGTGQRNVAAALVIATQNFTDPGVVAMLVTTTLAGLVVLLVAVRWFARLPRSTDRTGAPVPVQATVQEAQP